MEETQDFVEIKLCHSCNMLTVVLGKVLYLQLPEAALICDMSTCDPAVLDVNGKITTYGRKHSFWRNILNAE